jgi:hypothetical protein
MMKTKTELLEKLNALKGIAAEGTAAYQRSKDFLYKGLVGTYLWWIEAKKINGFLEEVYEANGLAVNEKDSAEKFTRIVRVIWKLDWTATNAPKLQQWSNVLREIDKEYTNNKAAYKTAAEQKLYNLIDGAGGIRKFIGADKYAIADLESIKETRRSNKKGRQQILDDAKIRDKHIELGKTYFATKAKSLLNIETNTPIPITADGYTLALLRQSPSSKTKYLLLATTSDSTLVEDSIIASYKVGKDDLQPSLRLLTEIIATQSIPVAMEKHRPAMQDSFSVVDGNNERFKWTQNKRLLFRKVSKDILLSENRTDCSVVTRIKPKAFPINIDTDTFLRVNDRTFVENEIIQSRNLALVGVNSNDQIPKTKNSNTAYTHLLETTNKVTGKKRNLYFYPTSNLQELSQFQADIDDDELGDAVWGAHVNKLWLEFLNATFINSWIAQEGIRYNQSKNKTAQVNLTTQRIKIQYYGENGNYGKHREFEVDQVERWSSNHKLNVATRDLIPVLNGICGMDVVGKVAIYAYASALHFEFVTDLANYQIAIPSANYKGKRIKAGFAEYKEDA